MQGSFRTILLDDGSWVSDPVPNAYDSAPIVLDAAGTPWIVHGPLSGGIALSGLIDGTWQTTVVDEGPGFMNAKVMAADDGIFIAWVNREAREVRVAFWHGASLDVEVAMTGIDEGLYPRSLSLTHADGTVGLAAGRRVAIRTAP